MIKAFGIVEALETYCEANGIFLIYGRQDYTNAYADRKVYEAYELIMLAEFTASPTITGSKVTANRYTGFISLGRKTEFETKSTLDETYKQKMDNRLSELLILLTEAIGNIACGNEYDVEGLTMKMELNKLDLNADFATCTLSLVE